MNFQTALCFVNVAIFVGIAVGVVLRRNRVLHPRIMYAAFAADVLMVLVIEFTRHAVSQTVDQVIHPTKALLDFHIAISVGAMALWIVQVISGRRILHGKGTAATVKRHGILACVFLLLRATNLVTSFMV